MADPFDLERFVDAQAPVYEQVRQEMKAGRKESHWMWFIFPQIAGLGQSPMSIRFAIARWTRRKLISPTRFSARGLGNARSSRSTLKARPRATFLVGSTK